MSLLNTEIKKETVEFNTGFVTALALYYGHRSQFQEVRDKGVLKSDLRNYGASDHLFDMEYPMNISSELKTQIDTFREHAFKIRLATISEKETEQLFDECLECIKAIDKEMFHILAEVKYP